MIRRTTARARRHGLPADGLARAIRLGNMESVDVTMFHLVDIDRAMRRRTLRLSQQHSSIGDVTDECDCAQLQPRRRHRSPGGTPMLTETGQESGGRSCGYSTAPNGQDFNATSMHPGLAQDTREPIRQGVPRLYGDRHATTPGVRDGTLQVPDEPPITAADLPALGLPRVYSPAQAAGILRGLGLTEMTECALRTRAYRKQVPFHLNGRRITFTVNDLREIAEGDMYRPQPRAEANAPATTPPPVPRRRSRTRTSDGIKAGPWRASRLPRRSAPGAMPADRG